MWFWFCLNFGCLKLRYFLIGSGCKEVLSVECSTFVRKRRTAADTVGVELIFDIWSLEFVLDFEIPSVVEGWNLEFHGVAYCIRHKA